VRDILKSRVSGPTMNETVLVTGNFNVLHPGHIRLLKFAKTFAMKLVVGVNSDKIAGSLVDSSETLRKEQFPPSKLSTSVFLSMNLFMKSLNGTSQQLSLREKSTKKNKILN
jgi:cytidyltransferase-like protein